jgi:magnesium-transporting ATPase (P-type)
MNDLVIACLSYLSFTLTLSHSPHSFTLSHCLPQGSIYQTQWKNIQVGSVLLLQNDDEVPADAIILDCGGIQGANTYVETAAIDGETNLKLRLPGIPQCATGTSESHSLVYEKSINRVTGLDKVKTIFHVELPNGSIHNFNGSMECEYSPGRPSENKATVRSEITLSEKNVCLRGSVIRASEWVVCVVMYTGKDTKLSRNSKSPPSKLSVVDSVVNRTLAIAIGCMVLICCLSALLAMYWQSHNNQADYLCLHEGDQDNAYTSDSGCESGATSSTLLILTFATLYNNFVAISMYVSLEMVYLWQAYFISQDLAIYDPVSDSPAEAHTSGMCADLGQVQYVLSDKTGTLTKNVMRLRRCSVAGMLYGAPAPEECGGGRESQPSAPLSDLLKSDLSSSKLSFSDSVFTSDQGGTLTVDVPVSLRFANLLLVCFKMSSICVM